MVPSEDSRRPRDRVSMDAPPLSESSFGPVATQLSQGASNYIKMWCKFQFLGFNFTPKLLKLKIPVPYNMKPIQSGARGRFPYGPEIIRLMYINITQHTQFFLSQPQSPTSLSKHLPQVTHQCLWLLICCKMASTLMVRCEHNVGAFVPPKLCLANEELGLER